MQGALAAPAARYVAVEPHPTSLELCRTHLELNGATWVEVVAAAAAAVAAPEGTARLLVPDDQLAAPTVAFVDADGELPRGMAGPLGAAIEVPTVDIRTLLSGVDLLKLDVEGQEHALLAAAENHLRTQLPTIVVEVLPVRRGCAGCSRGCAASSATAATFPSYDGWWSWIPGASARSPCSTSTASRT